MFRTIRQLYSNRSSGILLAMLIAMTAQGPTLFAQRVTASVTSGNLLITGDNQRNEVFIEETSPGVYMVSGEGATTINGARSRTFTVPNRVVNAVLNGGDDYCQVMYSSFNILTIDAGSGNDSIWLWEVVLTNPFIGGGFKLGANNDRIVLDYVKTENAITIYGEHGNDQVQTTECEFGFAPVMDGGGGYNTLHMWGGSIDEGRFAPRLFDGW